MISEGEKQFLRDFCEPFNKRSIEMIEGLIERFDTLETPPQEAL